MAGRPLRETLASALKLIEFTIGHYHLDAW
jgi:hypothetical protein